MRRYGIHSPAHTHQRDRANAPVRTSSVPSCFFVLLLARYRFLSFARTDQRLVRARRASRPNAEWRVPILAISQWIKAPLRKIVEIAKIVLQGVDIPWLLSYTHTVVRTPLCWTGEAIAHRQLNMICQNPFDSFGPFRAPNE